MDCADQLENRHHQNNRRTPNVAKSQEDRVEMFAFLVNLLDKELKI